jgi:hypothetical protein
MKTAMAIAVVERMRAEDVPEFMQDGFWMGLQMAALHPEWAAAAIQSYEAIEFDGVADMIAQCRREATRLANAIPVPTSDAGAVS